MRKAKLRDVKLIIKTTGERLKKPIGKATHQLMVEIHCQRGLADVEHTESETIVTLPYFQVMLCDAALNKAVKKWEAVVKKRGLQRE